MIGGRMISVAITMVAIQATNQYLELFQNCILAMKTRTIRQALKCFSGGCSLVLFLRYYGKIHYHSNEFAHTDRFCKSQ